MNPLKSGNVSGCRHIEHEMSGFEPNIVDPTTRL